MKALWDHNTKLGIIAGSAIFGVGVTLIRHDTKLKKSSTKLAVAASVLGIAAGFLLPTTEDEAKAKAALPVLTPNPTQPGGPPVYTPRPGTTNPWAQYYPQPLPDPHTTPLYPPGS